MKIFSFIINIFKSTVSTIVDVKTKTLKWIAANRTSVEGFITLFAKVYAALDGKEKMVKIVQLVIAATLGSNYTQYSEDVALAVEEKVQDIYDSMKVQGVV